MGQDVERDKKETHSVPAERSEQRAVSEAFTNSIIREFGKSATGGVNLTPYQKRLAQHLFIKIDAALKDLEKKRADSGKNTAQIVWGNINMQKLAMDAMHRIELGLDALIPNHISPIPYFNSRLAKYDLDLRIGYIGKDYYRRQMALDPPLDIVYELVHANDHFKPLKKSIKNHVESYEFDIKEPFNRGDVVGGFAYLVYQDERKNKLIIVTDDDFKKSQNKAPSQDFWKSYPEEMKYKTLVHRATNRLQVDPEKVNESFMAVEAAELADEQAFQAAIDVTANKGEILSIEGKAEEKTVAGTNGGGSDKQERAVVPEAHEEKQVGQQARQPGF